MMLRPLFQKSRSVVVLREVKGEKEFLEVGPGVFAWLRKMVVFFHPMIAVRLVMMFVARV